MNKAENKLFDVIFHSKLITRQWNDLSLTDYFIENADMFVAALLPFVKKQDGKVEEVVE